MKGRLIGSNTIMIRRFGPVRYIEGDIVKDSFKRVKVLGSLQPENNLQLVREVFGSHIQGAIKIYTIERLRTQENGCDADIVEYNGRLWEVSQVRQYTDVIPHYKTIAVLLKDET